MAVRLVPMGDGPPISLDRPIIFVGRHSDCDVRIESKKISRRHCCFIQLEDKLVVRDLGSTNGVYCNGQRVEEAMLSPDDEVQIGNLRYQVTVNDTGPSSPIVNAAKRVDCHPEQGGAIVDDQVPRPAPDAPQTGHLS